MKQKSKILSKKEVEQMVSFGASKIFKMQGTITDEHIDQILKRGEEKTKEQDEKINKQIKKKQSVLSSLKIESISIYEFLGEDYQEKKKEDEKVL